MLTNNITTKSNKISIVDGSFRVQVPQGTEGSVDRVNKTGKKVSEMVYTTISGDIKDIRLADTDWGRKLIIKLDDDELSLGYADSLAVNIYKILPNLDAGKKTSIMLQKTLSDKGTNKTSIFISQEDKAAKWAYTRDTPNGLPPMEKIMVKGQETWDNTKQVEFLVKNSLTPFINKVKGVNNDPFDN